MIWSALLNRRERAETNRLQQRTATHVETPLRRSTSKSTAISIRVYADLSRALPPPLSADVYVYRAAAICHTENAASTGPLVKIDSAIALALANVVTEPVKEYLRQYGRRQRCACAYVYLCLYPYLYTCVCVCARVCARYVCRWYLRTASQRCAS